ncbi:MAG TPA: TonB-dependent receptor plug domain-containing protein, partial [Chitinophagaceae bacterium]|nr:TonB-dependent receptor plug domain-containing protein [Chitinophagaceae bacterium]
MKYKISILFIFWLSNVNAQLNQNDSLLEIIIKDKKTTQIINTQTIDKQTQLQYQTNSLNHLLALHTNVFVKNYGVGSLSTISIRGSSAAQTAVLWHGLNLNNAMTGLADFSILPVSFFDEIKINYSSNTPNALAGHIELSND